MTDEQTSTQPVDSSLGFDRTLERLRQVVARLEQGNLSLEQSLLAFEEGVGLSRRGAEILDAAERRVEILIRGEDGAARPQPFGAGEGDGRP
jgi:exodeoxyribonuclease VII small subunit